MTYQELRKALNEGKMIGVKEFDGERTYIVREGAQFIERRQSDDSIIKEGRKMSFFVEELLADCFPNLYIYKKPILDKVEKRYLSDVIRPFRGKYKFTIIKNAASMKCSDKEKECICIRLSNDEGNDSILLPYFNAGEMYKGMKVDEKYSLEELGL